MTREGVVRLIQTRVKEAETAVRVADKWEVSPQYLSDVLSGKREPGAKILKCLGLERVVMYRKMEKEG